MKSTFKTLFYLKKNEPKKDGTVAIMARITVDGETKQFSTKKTILPEVENLIKLLPRVSRILIPFSFP